MALLASCLDGNTNHHPFIVVQSSIVQSALPILRSLLDVETSESQKPRKKLLFCFLYPPTSLTSRGQSDLFRIYDWVDHVPGYCDPNSQNDILGSCAAALEDSSVPIDVIVDSIDSLLSDNDSVPTTFRVLSELSAAIQRNANARLIVHSQSPSTILPLICQTSFSSSLVHIVAHPPALVQHMADEFLMPPPPTTPPPKYWGVFMPLSGRIHDTERLVFGVKGEGTGHPSDCIVELIVRDGSGRKRVVQRVLEGWSITNGQAKELIELECVKTLIPKQRNHTPIAPDPTQNLSFNLSLTASQQESRSQVPLPYVHEGNPSGAILYDPDSADDIDDDDPDEDLDI